MRLATIDLLIKEYTNKQLLLRACLDKKQSKFLGLEKFQSNLVFFQQLFLVLHNFCGCFYWLFSLVTQTNIFTSQNLKCKFIARDIFVSSKYIAQCTHCTHCTLYKKFNNLAVLKGIQWLENENFPANLS